MTRFLEKCDQLTVTSVNLRVDAVTSFLPSTLLSLSRQRMLQYVTRANLASSGFATGEDKKDS